MDTLDSSAHPESSPFGDLGLRSSVVRALAQHGFTQPTAFQREFIPLFLGGQDVMALAPSGTGRTIAYSLPMLHLSDRNSPAQGVVIVPTEQSAQRAVGELRRLGEFTPIRARGIREYLQLMAQMSRDSGGRDRDDRRDRGGRHGGGRGRDRGGRGFGGRDRNRGDRGRRPVEPPHLVVGDVETIADAVETNELDLDRLRFLVFEDPEAMLEAPMRSALDAILGSLADGQQSVIISSDLQPAVEDVFGRLLHSPARVNIPVPELSDEMRKATDLAPFLAELEARRLEREARRSAPPGDQRRDHSSGPSRRDQSSRPRGPMPDVKTTETLTIHSESVSAVINSSSSSSSAPAPQSPPRGDLPVWERAAPLDPVKFPMGIAPTKPPRRVLRGKYPTRRGSAES